LTVRLIELALRRHGEPPARYAWLAFGSAARSELTLASDQDNGLAYADDDDPDVDRYFRRVAEDVNAGLSRCGLEADTHGVLAQNDEWRMTAASWVGVFEGCLEGSDNERLLRAVVAFDFRHVSGDLSIVPRLTDVMRETPRHARFRAGLAELGAEIRSPLGFRQRMAGSIDIKQSGLLPVQNIARYHALARGITIQSTAERLTALCEVDADGAEHYRTLRESYLTMQQLQLEHHAEAVRRGRKPENVVDTEALRPLTRVTLREALRVVAAAQERLPRHPV
jgi:CBS domain-containing protein